MYSYIKGKIDNKTSDYLVIDNNGIGYRIASAMSTLERIEAGQEAKIYTYMHVREDNISLYGFLTSEELRVFELLISVSGIGPKVANSVLSSLSPSKFGLAVITGDVQGLKSVPGIGLKTAQRIILELKDKLKTEDAIDSAQVQMLDGNDNVSEAVNALQVLGYSTAEALKVLRTIDTENMDIEGVIKEALKKLAR